jgi:ubiquinone/menaquinone biosynthesis C-methylase UbiE
MNQLSEPPMREKPFPDSYWVLPGQFLAGGYPGSSRGEADFTRRRMAALLQSGMTTFIDLTRPGETPAYIDTLHQEADRFGITVDYQPKPVEDRGLPSRAQMVSILDAIDAALDSGGKVYLHCLGGIGRTGTVVGCWLARHGLTGEAALARLNALYRTSEQSRFFSRSPETDAQVLFILDWPEAARSTSAAPFRSLKNDPGTLDWHARFQQQAAWTRDLRAYIFEKAGLSSARRVLEVGCGTGAILMDLSTEAAVHGLDINRSRLEAAGLHDPQAELVCGNALALPYASGSFDLTFCHYLLLWVSQPLQALREMRRLTAPGGYVIAFAEPDYTARLDRPAELAPLGRWQAESLRRQGADPALGSKLADLFRQAGISPVESGRIQENRKKTLSPAEWQQEWVVMEADLKSFVPASELARLKRLDEASWQSGTRVLSVPTYFAWGQVGQMV